MGGIYKVDPWRVNEHWREVEPLVASCLGKAKEHRWIPADIWYRLMEDTLQLWLIKEDERIKTIVLTELIVYPRAKECNVFMVSGELLDDWRNDLDNLLKWAKDFGYEYASSMARKGFAKAVGWEQRQTYIVGVL